MKRFILYFLKTVLIIVLEIIVLDITYTTIYKTSKVKRSKYQWARQLKNQHFDYVLLGSSRMIHHIDPEILDEKYNLNGLNLGYSACGTNELLIMLDNLLKNGNKVDTLFLQIDYIWNTIYPDVLARVAFMPYIRKSEIKSNFFRFGSEYKNYYYIPFYRYIMFEPKIGFRDVMLTAMHKTVNIANTGFAPNAPHNFGGENSFEYTLIDEMNINIDILNKLCAKNGIHVCYLTAPIYNGKTNNELFNRYLSDYHDFSGVITEQSLFNDATHLNADGAKLFTEIFGEYYFEKH